MTGEGESEREQEREREKRQSTGRRTTLLLIILS